MGEPMDWSWYVAMAKPGRTMRAVDELIAGPTCVICPIERFETRINGRRFTQERPLLGRYLIVSAPSAEVLTDVKKAAAGEVTGFISDSRGPREVHPAVVDQLLDDDAEGLFFQIRGHKAFKAGDRVKITDGPYADMTGELKRTKGARRWQIFLDAAFVRMPINAEEDMIEHEVKARDRAA